MSSLRSAEPPLRPATRLRHLALFAAVLAIQFAIFEVALRVWGSSEAAPAFQGLFEGDPEIGYRMKPGARARFTTAEFETDIAINAAGVRDDEELGPKAPGERRVIVLGDSLVLSVQVPMEQTFGELLERRLNASNGAGRYRVINAGVQGYGPVEEALFFEKFGASFEPDLVIVMVFVGNDAEEAFRSAAKLRGRSSDDLGDAREAVETELRRLVRRSMVLQVLRLRARMVLERLGVPLAPPEPPLQSYAAAPPPWIAEGLRVARIALERIAAAASRLNARTAIVLMPARFQLDDPDYGRLKIAVAAAGGELVRDAATERFHATLAALPYPRLDLLDPLRATRPGPDLFFQANVHLTPYGHDVVANALAGFIAEHNLLEDGATR